MRPLLATVARQMAALQDRYPDLALVRHRSGRLVVEGTLGFAMTHERRTVEDEFDVELRIPPDYPASPPNVYEVAGRLDGFDHLFTDGRLCLGAPVEVRMRFAERPSLLCFTEDLVVPFLFAFSYKASYGRMPFGELAHGVEGQLDYYNRFFGTPTEQTVSLLRCLVRDEHDSGVAFGKCPCGSGRKLKRCHGPELSKLRSHQTAEETEGLLKAMVSASRSAGGHRRPLLPRGLRRQLGEFGKIERRNKTVQKRSWPRGTTP